MALFSLSRGCRNCRALMLSSDNVNNDRESRCLSIIENNNVYRNITYYLTENEIRETGLNNVLNLTFTCIWQ